MPSIEVSVRKLQSEDDAAAAPLVEDGTAAAVAGAGEIEDAGIVLAAEETEGCGVTVGALTGTDGVETTTTGTEGVPVPDCPPTTEVNPQEPAEGPDVMSV